MHGCNFTVFNPFPPHLVLRMNLCYNSITAKTSGGSNMCLICDRIKMIAEGTNPYFVKELQTGYVVIGDHQHFKGYTLFLCKDHKVELYQLDYAMRLKYMEEMSIVAEAVAKAFGAEKMNYELLGNGDTHLHWHLFPRVCGDIGDYGNNGKGPVWWLPREIMYSDKNSPTQIELLEMKTKLLNELDLLI